MQADVGMVRRFTEKGSLFPIIYCRRAPVVARSQMVLYQDLLTPPSEYFNNINENNATIYIATTSPHYTVIPGASTLCFITQSAPLLIFTDAWRPRAHTERWVQLYQYNYLSLPALSYTAGAWSGANVISELAFNLYTSDTSNQRDDCM